MNEEQIVNLGRQPISPDAPTGADPSDDETVMSMMAELGKLDRVDAEDGAVDPDWYTVEQSGMAVLQSTSKDVEVAAGLGLALFRQHGYPGLAAALALCTELVKNFWADLYPARPRRRKARLEAMCDRFTDGNWFSQYPPKTDGDFDGLDKCLERAQQLHDAVKEHMPDDPPELGQFIRKGKAKAATRPKAQAAAPAAGEASATASAGGGGAEIAGEIADTGSAIKAVLQCASFLRKADATDPMPYLLMRVAKWGKISLPSPEAAKSGEPPEAGEFDRFTHQYGNRMWDKLLLSTEAAFRSNDPLWLDLQYWLCEAMKGLGGQYDAAREAVMLSTAQLLHRVGAGVFDLVFRNGKPFCSPEARMWIESDVMSLLGGGGGGGPSVQADGQLTEAYGKARKLAGDGKLKEALRELQDGSRICAQRRDRFLWRLRMAQLCFDARRLQLAAPLLEECYEEIKRFGIDEWEPILAVDVAQTLYRCRKFTSASGPKATAEELARVRESFAWLCQLDPAAALAAEPSGK